MEVDEEVVDGKVRRLRRRESEGAEKEKKKAWRDGEGVAAEATVDDRVKSRRKCRNDELWRY